MLRFIFYSKQRMFSTSGSTNMCTKMSCCGGSAEVSSGGVNVLQDGQLGSDDLLQASLFAAACSCPGV